MKNKFGEGYTLIAQIETGRDEERRMTRQSLVRDHTNACYAPVSVHDSTNCSCCVQELGRRRSSTLKREGGQAQQLQSWEVELQPLRNYIERTFPGWQRTPS